jgi:thiol-disulfide isomerase/thioredoxin
MTRAHGLLFAVVAALAVAGGAGYQLWRLGVVGTPEQNPVVAGRTVLATQPPDLDGRPQPLAQWRGRVLVVNFWATWCPPCREEIPMFVRVQERYRDAGLKFVGIAIDQPERVAEFAREFRINYPVLVGGLESMELMRQVGNRAGALPYTLVIDRQGKLVSQQLGELKEDRLQSLVRPLL